MTDRTPSERAEAAAIRRRWITLGELLAVVGVLISALALWNNYSERSHAEAQKAGESRQARARAATLLLRGEASRDGDRLMLSPIGTEQSIQSQTIIFPAALGVAPVETTGDARIEAGWFADGLKQARHAAQRKSETVGDERLPVAIASRFIAAGGTAMSDVAIYDVGYALDGRFLVGSTLRLRGLSRVGRVGATAAQARIDAIWRARQPTISAGAKK